MLDLKQNNQFKEAPLFEYLEEKKNEEFAIKIAKTKTASLRKFYTTNILLAFGIIFSICLMFYAQYKVDKLQNRIDLVQRQIDDYKNEIKLLNVEWVYLTRPDRLRFLSGKYLKNNKNIIFAQVKDHDTLEKFYLANLRKHNQQELNISYYSR